MGGCFGKNRNKKYNDTNKHRMKSELDEKTKLKCDDGKKENKKNGMGNIKNDDKKKIKRKIVCNGDVCEILSGSYSETSDMNSDSSSDDRIPQPLIEKDTWTIYGASYCSFCNNARQLAQKHNLKFMYINTENYAKSRQDLKIMTEEYRTIPVIYHEGKFIGGFTELKYHLNKQ
jgi:glutaredoxin 3